MHFSSLMEQYLLLNFIPQHMGSKIFLIYPASGKIMETLSFFLSVLHYWRINAGCGSCYLTFTKKGISTRGIP